MILSTNTTHAYGTANKRKITKLQSCLNLASILSIWRSAPIPFLQYYHYQSKGDIFLIFPTAEKVEKPPSYLFPQITRGTAYGPTRNSGGKSSNFLISWISLGCVINWSLASWLDRKRCIWLPAALQIRQKSGNYLPLTDCTMSMECLLIS